MSTYTAKQRKEIVETLQAAKEYLCKNNKGVSRLMYICLCIDTARVNKKCTEQGAILTRNIIMDRLGFNFSVLSWLKNNVSSFNSDTDHMDEAAFVEQLQLYRHRWVDSMIAEFKGQQ